MLVPAFARGIRIPIQGFGVTGDAFAVVVDGDVVVGDMREVAGFEVGDAVRVLDKGRRVAADECRFITVPEEQGAVFARDNDAIVAGGRYGDGVAAFELLRGALDRRPQGDVVGEVVFDEVRDDFGVRFALEDVILAKVGFEIVVVFDDAVVDDGDVAGAVCVGVGVLLGGFPMRAPAGVADPADNIVPGGDGEFINFALGFVDREGVAGQGDTGGVIPAVFEVFESLMDDAACRFRADVAGDSTHDPWLAAHDVTAIVDPPGHQCCAVEFGVVPDDGAGLDGDVTANIHVVAE